MYPKLFFPQLSVVFAQQTTDVNEKPDSVSYSKNFFSLAGVSSEVMSKGSDPDALKYYG